MGTHRTAPGPSVSTRHLRSRSKQKMDFFNSRQCQMASIITMVECSRPPHSSADVDRAIELEEQTIRTSEKNISQLRTYRNPLSRMCRLPLEVLGEIFATLAFGFAHNCYPTYGQFAYRWKTAHWVVVTMVCRHWREVSLRTPRM